jgi:antitoxin component YwqK of YwqJK toxin-antitoxin module
VTAQPAEKYYDYQWKECEPQEARFYSTVNKTDSGYVRNDYFLNGMSLQMAGKYKDADTEIENGYFHYFYANAVLSSTGKYINGKREGLWLEYHHNAMLMDSTVYSNDHISGTSMGWHPNGFLSDSIITNVDGTGIMVNWFDNGNLGSAGFIVNYTKPDKIWKYYHKNGQLSAVEKYNNGKLENKSYYDENGIILPDTSNKDRGAAFPGGLKAWEKFLMKKVYFPEGYKIVNADKVVVVISFTVNEDGIVEDVHVTTPFNPEFDLIAKRAVAASPKWIPAMNHNRKVKAMWRQPVTFSQSSD